MALVLDGKTYNVPGVKTRSWLDNPSWHLKAGQDRYKRPAGPVTAIVLHTTTGSDGQVVRPGVGPYVDPLKASLRVWTNAEKSSGAHLWVGPDGTVFGLADLAAEATPHAGNGSVNNRSIGIEMYSSGSKNVLYLTQIAATVKLIDWLTRMFPLVQRQVQWPYINGQQPVRIGPRGHDKADFFGIFGHREAADNRGRGDPGDAIFLALIRRGYEPWDTDTNQDKLVWMTRQRDLGIPQTGVPDLVTYRALLASGRPYGKWVSAPGDKSVWPKLLLAGLSLGGAAAVVLAVRSSRKHKSRS